MFYAQFNAHGSTTQIGFANAWQVASFETKAARDAWVAQRADRADVASVTKAQALKLAGPYHRHLHATGGHLAHIHFLSDDNATFIRAF